MDKYLCVDSIGIQLIGRQLLEGQYSVWSLIHEMVRLPPRASPKHSSRYVSASMTLLQSNLDVTNVVLDRTGLRVERIACLA